MTYRRDPDRYTKKAKKEGFAARSVYKLEEIDRRVKLVRQGLRVLDMGAAPGSWVQYVAPKIGAKGKMLTLDLEPLRVKVQSYVTHMIVDVLETDPKTLLEHGPFDLVLSDMAPHTTGIPFADVHRSVELVQRVLDYAEVLLVPGGRVLAKVFMGDDFDLLRARMRGMFDEVRVIKPEASRKESIETYLLGSGRKAVAPVSAAQPVPEK